MTDYFKPSKTEILHVYDHPKLWSIESPQRKTTLMTNTASNTVVKNQRLAVMETQLRALLFPDLQSVTIRNKVGMCGKSVNCCHESSFSCSSLVKSQPFLALHRWRANQYGCTSKSSSSKQKSTSLAWLLIELGGRECHMQTVRRKLVSWTRSRQKMPDPPPPTSSKT